MNTLLRFLQKPLLMALLVLASFSLVPQKAQAQWTVFDPTTYASITQIWSEDISTNAKLALEVQQGASLLTQTMQIYRLAKQEASFLEKGHILQGIGFAASHAAVVGHPDWDKAMVMTSGLAQSASTWQNMTNRKSSLKNRIALINSFASSSLNSLGNCNSAAQNNSMAAVGISSLITSMSGDKNTSASLKNLGNLAQSQTLRYHQCEENLAEQRLKLELIRAHESLDRDQSTADTNTSVDTYNTSGGGEWDVTPLQDLQRKGMH